MRRQIRRAVAQQIVDTVKDLSACDINFIDRNGIKFASTDATRVGDFHEIGRQVVQTGETIEVAADDSFFGTHKGVNLPVRHRGEIIAAIGLTGEPAQVRRYAYLAQRITALILREQELDEQSSNERAQLNYVIRSLISGDAPDYGVYVEFLQRFQLDPDAKFVTVVVRVNAREDPAGAALAEYRIQQAFEQAGGRLFTFIHPNEHVLLIEAERYRQWAYVFRQLAGAHGGALRVGVGNADTLARQGQSYQAAKIALNSLIGGEHLAEFDRMDLEILLGAIPDGARQRFLERVASRLDERDVDILRAYFGFGMSLKAASEALFMHKNTLQYQLDRIGRSCGYNPRAFQDAVILYFALKLRGQA